MRIYLEWNKLAAQVCHHRIGREIIACRNLRPVMVNLLETRFSCSFLLLLFSGSVMSNSLWPHELQHARLLCPSLSPRVCSNSCSLSQWCHPVISSSVIRFSSSLRSFPASESFPISWLCASGGQSIQLQHQSFQWIFRTDFLSDWLVGFPCSLRDSRVSSNTTVQEHQFFGAQLSL